MESESELEGSASELVVEDAPAERQKLGQFSSFLFFFFSFVSQKSCPSHEQFHVTGQLFLMGLAAFWFGISAVNAGLGVLLVADRVMILLPDAGQGSLLGAVQSVAGLCAGVMYPLVGSLSDSYSSRWGRRTPFMLMGTFACVISFVVMGVAGAFVTPTNVFAFVVFVIGVIAVNMSLALVSAPYTALLPDLVRPEQLGASSGWMGVMTMLGNAVGTTLLGQLLSPFRNAFGDYYIAWCVLLAVVLVLSLAGTILVVREKPHISPYTQPGNLHAEAETGNFVRRTLRRVQRGAVSGFRAFLSPFRSRDFLWVFLTKYLMVSGILITSGFLLFWVTRFFTPLDPNCLENRTPCYVMFGILIDTPQVVTTAFLGPLLVGATVASLVAGILSDKFGRKVLVYISGGLQAATVAIMVAIPYVWPTALEPLVLMGFAFGMGYGAFLAVDFALVVEVLPSEKDAGKDLGVWHMSTTLANITAPFGAGAIADVFNAIDPLNKAGYAVIFGISALCFLVATVLLSRVSVGGRPKSTKTEVVDLSNATSSDAAIPLEDMNTMSQEITVNQEEPSNNDLE